MLGARHIAPQGITISRNRGKNIKKIRKSDVQLVFENFVKLQMISRSKDKQCKRDACCKTPKICRSQVSLCTKPVLEMADGCRNK